MDHFEMTTSAIGSFFPALAARIGLNFYLRRILIPETALLDAKPGAKDGKT
jgi:hypothetical protein